MRQQARRLAPAAARRYTAVLLAGALLLSAPASSRAASPATGGGDAPVAAVTLSNLHTLSRWAYPAAASAVYQQPTASSRLVDRLRFLTPDGQAQLYLVLRSYTVAQTAWMLVSVPRRPNGIIGWVPASALGQLHVTRDDLRINRATLHAVLYRAGRAIWSAPVGVGQPSSPTPAGHFYVIEKLIPLADPFYGPYAIGTSAYAPTLTDWPGGGVVGIHGTNAPQLIPGRPSHGCIRLRDADIARLWRLIDVGAPIEVV